MAHYDQDTYDFISKVADEEPKQKPTAKFIARQAMGLVKDLSKGKAEAEAALAKRVISLATGTTMKQMEKSSGVKPLAIYDMLNHHYGMDWHDWEPETLWRTLDLEHAIEPSEQVKNLAQSLQVICRTDFAFEDYSVFENVGQALNLNPVMFGMNQPLEPDEIALTHVVLTKIRPQEEYEDDVLGYIAACCKLAGMVYLPDDLFPVGCQEFLDKIGNNLELKTKVITRSSGEDVAIQLERIGEIREYLEERT